MKVPLRILMLRICLLLLSVVSINVFAVTEAVDIYSDQQLISLIRSNQYLQRVKADDCQLVQDIEARAEVLQQPMYQFLWAEMLNNGVCVKAHPSRGMALLQTSAEQGSAEAMVKLADYYYRGKLVVKDPNRAVQYVLPAAANGDLTARMTLVHLFGEGYGSPADYELGYHWLYNSIFDDDAQQKKASSLLQMLAAKMPASIVARAQQPQLYTR
ncbi:MULTISPECIES: tetratricopeptide repeat protein [unclassified Shewanella]|jgi:TPR repeat protein|uniref:tetratricopeptide repeat protein n=2 Tax=unclassified Shewanella TaxID=196818 RepID=UPI000C326F41|nr:MULTISPECIES: SEL1-like repeat protein [unclassified Shewanella]MBB1360605.1 sel1 repeat family protein [Shewanella sp. SR44-4]MBO1898032.1 sel1 repeat family protein [Shewanella sp. BF02_Schw]PKH34703.1 flagellar protein MotX [Shewanella sp. ALD9]QHS14833.1 sel1 repeat family protein [Shewanella sp. Arc9-LZ]